MEPVNAFNIVALSITDMQLPSSVLSSKSETKKQVIALNGN